MPQTPSGPEGVVREIKRCTRKHYSAEEKIRIVLEGLKGEASIAEICRREGIYPNVYYKWSKVKIFLIVVISLTSVQLWAQTITIVDSVFTPSGYEDGPLTGTVYIPIISNGVGVVLAHYYTGTRQTLAVWCDTLAAHGYVAMTIDYYDWSDSTYGIYPKPIRAFKIAVEFLRRNAGRFGISTGKIVGLGKSEGAFHWGETIIWDNDDAYFGTDPFTDDHLDAVVLLYGLYDNDHFLQSTIPLNQLLASFFSPDSSLRSTKGDCIANVANITTPVLMVHGTSDGIIQYQQSVQLHDSLIAHGKTSQLLLGSTWDHGFDNSFSPPYSFTAAGLIVKDTVLAFLQRTLHVITSVSPAAANRLPGQFSLGQNNPNPFNPSTTINYQLPSDSRVTLKIFNLLGQVVATLVNQTQQAGYKSVNWNASNFASGIYFCRLEASSLANPSKTFRSVKKAVLMK